MINVETIFLSLFMLICREICFVAIYAVLAQNLFCRDLRTFVWRKIYSEIVLVEKKGQISGMCNALLIMVVVVGRMQITVSGRVATVMVMVGE